MLRSITDLSEIKPGQIARHDEDGAYAIASVYRGDRFVRLQLVALANPRRVRVTTLPDPVDALWGAWSIFEGEQTLPILSGQAAQVACLHGTLLVDGRVWFVPSDPSGRDRNLGRVSMGLTPEGWACVWGPVTIGEGVA